MPKGQRDIPVIFPKTRPDKILINLFTGFILMVYKVFPACIYWIVYVDFPDGFAEPGLEMMILE